LWVALGRSSAVHRYDRAGRIDAVLELPTSNPTSVTFGGVDGGDLYITTSWFDLEADDRLAQPLAGAIYRCRPGVTGPPSPRYRRPTAAPTLGTATQLDVGRANPGALVETGPQP
jgi:xylono-1,5-lactonase